MEVGNLTERSERNLEMERKEKKRRVAKGREGSIRLICILVNIGRLYLILDISCYTNYH